LIQAFLISGLLWTQPVLVDVEPRRLLEEEGIRLSPWLVSDAVHLPEQAELVGLGIVEARVSFDFQRLFGWKGLSLELAPLFIFGGAPSGTLGDFQALDNIAAAGGVDLFEAFVRARLAPLTLQLGLIDLNRIIDVLPKSKLFVHSTAGYGAVLGNLRPNGGLSFPVTSLTLAAVLEVKHWVLSLLAADGVPGRPGAVASKPIFFPGIGLSLGAGDGLLALAELAWTGWGKWAIGGWASSTEYGMDRGRGGAGGWASFSLPVLPPRGGFGGATLFFRGGLGTPDASFFRAELGGGLVFEGALVKADAVGFAAFAARGSEVPLWETAYELTYKVPVFRGLAFQPFLMWIDQPLQGESSPALGLRLDLHL
jgi:carbohydrate-selective porin OprB